jgi:hypothetical protein
MYMVGLTRSNFRSRLSRMAIILILAVALVVGVIMPNRWALLLPIGLGVSVASIVAAAGQPLGDTPLPFLVLTSTLVMVAGQGLRARVISPTT